MTLEEFAKKAGVKLILCGPGYGGKYGYITEDCPNSSVNGFRTEKSALKQWAKDTFGNKTAKALFSLLDK